MATFVLHSDITIGTPGVNQYRFSGVHEVRIKRSLHSYVDTAIIKLPSIAKLKLKGRTSLSNTVTTGSLWNDGDPVTIYLGYSEGSMREEFRGFIKRRDLSLPLTIECEGYSWQLRRNKIVGSWKSIAVQDLLNIAIQGTNIKQVICTHNTVLNNLEAAGATGAEIIDAIIRNTDHTLGVFFISPDVLWCGLVYTPYQGNNDIFNLTQVKYRLGYNVVKDNNLKERTLKDNIHNTIYVKKTTSGQRLYGATSWAGEIRKYKKFLNHIASAPELKILAQEKQLRENYQGYEGTIPAFLQPYALPGYTAYIEDNRYPERNGIYLIESTEVTFGQHGARRNIGIGPKVGFVNTITAA